MNIELISIRSNGNLSFLEAERDFPFPIKRMYYIHGEQAGAHRGFHAHKTLKQLLFCPHGKIKILIDDGKEKTEVLLDSPEKGLILPPDYWHEMLWQANNSVLCVLASEYYNENDYIRDYDKFASHLACKNCNSGGGG